MQLQSSVLFNVFSGLFYLKDITECGLLLASSSSKDLISEQSSDSTDIHSMFNNNLIDLFDYQTSL